MKYFWLLSCSILLIWPELVGAVGVGVRPASLDFNINNQETNEQYLIITNPSAEPGLFVVSADDFADWFSIKPTELRLEPQETGRAKIAIKPHKSGQFATNLSVIGYPLDTRSFKAGSGVKVPVTFTVLDSRTWPWTKYLGLVFIILAFLGAWLAWRQYRQRQKIWWKIKKIFVLKKL